MHLDLASPDQGGVEGKTTSVPTQTQMEASKNTRDAQTRCYLLFCHIHTKVPDNKLTISTHDAPATSANPTTEYQPAATAVAPS